jgi:mediator of RNA polymerase II transcription subunit 13
MTDTRIEASLGFPSESPTNAYVLENFGHVVYMVSTVSGGHGGTEASILARLKNAEKELRSQSPLVFLDIATNELFTFHRLLDFQKDGKNIYGRLAMVLRQNKCINSFKSALRASDILKEENTRLKGILLAAVFLALRASLLNDTSYIPLGMRSFLRAPALYDPQAWDKPPERLQRPWEIDMVDLQLLPQGQLLVVNVSRKPAYFSAVSDILEQTPAKQDYSNLGPGILCLAPSGQMARYTDGEIFMMPFLDSISSRPGTAQSEQVRSTFRRARRRAWREHLLIWMAEQGVPDTQLTEKYWVEVDILISRKQEQSAFETKDERFVCKRVLWPAQLCFYTQPPQSRSMALSEIPNEDPIAFVQDWLLKSDERAREIAKTGSTSTDDAGGQDTQQIEHMDEDSGFGSTPYMHNAFSAGLLPSQTMYPTPPDMPFTQATPGMSSVDGIGMTPADTTKPGPAAVQQQIDIDMLDRMDTSGVGTGTYDEDLFEDLPTHRFSTTGATDEPDWDFFEQHNVDTANGTHSDEVVVDTHGTPNKIEEDTNESAPMDAEAMPPPQLESTQPLISSPLQDAKEDVLMHSVADVPAEPMQEDAENLTTVDVPCDDSTPPQIEAAPQLLEQPPEKEVWKKPAIPSGRGRRRSLYDSSEDISFAADHDERYTANGAFWFDATAESASKKVEVEGSKIRNNFRHVSSQRSSSSGSLRSAGSSFYEVDPMDFDEDEVASSKRKWTEYQQDPSSTLLEPTPEELEQIHLDNQNFLKLLRPMSLDHTWLLGDQTHVTPSVQNSNKPDNAAMVAQILVDQLSQTSLPRQEDLALQKRTSGDVRPDISKALDSPYGRLEPVSFTGLAKANDNSAQNDGTRRLRLMEQHQLSLSRTEKRLIISSIALSLWENLNLQPMGGRKDVQSFCIHPASANLEAGSRMFLARLSETYVGCNLGNHSIGQIAGMSNNGLVSWSDGDDNVPSLEQCCERLGTALARVPLTSDNIIIYMIIMPESELSPISLIEGFCVLFESYLKACNKQHTVELGLQLIPYDFVASPDTLVMRSSEEHLRLAIEVYNRFPPTKLEDKRAFCGSAVVLAESSRRRIKFDMSGQGGPSSEAGARCLHVSYSYSQNHRWIVAAWTDELGFRALTMCYPVKGPGRSKSRPRSDIIRDIWEVSQDLMLKERRRWRLVIARDGFYDPSEINDWAAQFNGRPSTSTCSLVLLSVDLNPTLVVQPTTTQTKLAQGLTPQPHPPNCSTPVSTPQPSITSPDQYLTATPTPSGSFPLNAATPPELALAFDPLHEPDLSIHNPTTTTWSVVLPFGLNQSHELLPSRPALLSGFLLKRRGLRDEDGLTQLGVHLVYTSALAGPLDADEGKRKAVVAAREELLRDMLGQFGGLVTLAGTRGCIDPVEDVVPWHIATAVKGARVLHKWM